MGFDANRMCWSVLSVFVALANGAPEAPIDVQSHDAGLPYAGQCVVSVVADRPSEIVAAESIAEGLWSEGAGLYRPFEVQVRVDRLEELTKAGLDVTMVIPDLRRHASAQWDLVRAEDRRERTTPRGDAGPRGVGPHDEAWFNNYRQLNEIYGYMNALAAARPDLASVSDVGGTVQGRDLFAITITGPETPGNPGAQRPVILWNGGQHAREWISPMTVTYLASRLVGDYGVDPEVTALVDSIRFVIVPVANPDGYLYTWSNDRYWRKNRRANSLSSFGVDLNRNWGYEWGGDGASSFSTDETYRGTAPFSEPETQSLRDLALSFGDRLAAHIDYHSYSQLILWPFGYALGVQTPEPDRTFFDTLANDLSDTILSSGGVFYDPIQSWELYAASGTSTDWFFGTLGTKSISFELRPSSGGLDGFDPAPSQILPCAHENWVAAKLFAHRTTEPISISVTPPTTVPADQPATVRFGVAAGVEQVDTASVTAFARVDGAPFVEIGAAPDGQGSYDATLPAASCGSTIEFYLRAESLAGDAVLSPLSGFYSAEAIPLGFEDDMESDTGWTVGAPGDTATTGIWSRMAPQATAAQPGSDHSPAGTLCWITDGNAGTGVGSFDIDGGATTLTSPAIDATNDANDATISFWLWYSNDAGASPNEDSMPIQISNDNGATWHALETISVTTPDWTEKRYRVSDFVAPTDAVRVRFVASDLINGSIVEAGVDDLRVEFGTCDSVLTADLAAPFGVFNFFDIAAYIELYNAQDPGADYAEPFGTFNFFDITRFIELYNAGI